MKLSYNTKYPSVDDLREKARKRIPKFAFEYLDGGCNEDVNLLKNTAEIRQPYHCNNKNTFATSDETSLLRKCS